ncbi:hypothetical protein Dda_8979 [Drechslerella dactyloides]|uniref:Uncharacterized protein n=1 Tax=Drechslerella dactyloides TaxID=74499 RepID=A0AAD6IQS9_DREDA|nr:hypothetical protein Dda_8979 [Drechslerella dactyloides]
MRASASSYAYLAIFVGVATLAPCSAAWYFVFLRDPQSTAEFPLVSVYEQTDGDSSCRDVPTFPDDVGKPLRWINVANVPGEPYPVMALAFWTQSSGCAGPPDLIIRYSGDSSRGIYFIDLGGTEPSQGAGLADNYLQFKPLVPSDRWYREYITSYEESLAVNFAEAYNADSGNGILSELGPPENPFPAVYAISDIRYQTVQYHTTSMLRSAKIDWWREGQDISNIPPETAPDILERETENQIEIEDIGPAGTTEFY